MKCTVPVLSPLTIAKDVANLTANCRGPLGVRSRLDDWAAELAKSGTIVATPEALKLLVRDLAIMAHSNAVFQVAPKSRYGPSAWDMKIMDVGGYFLARAIIRDVLLTLQNRPDDLVDVGKYSIEVFENQETMVRDYILSKERV